MRWTVVVAMLLAGADARADLMRSPDGKETRDVPTESVEFARKDGWVDVPAVLMRTTDGAVVRVYEPYVADQRAKGWWLMTPEEAQAHESKEIAERLDRIVDETTGRRWYAKPSNIGIVALVLGGGLAVLWWLARGIRIDREGK